MKSYLILLTVFLSGCGLINYHTEVFIQGEKKAEVKSNIPSKVKIDNVEIDQRGQSWWEKIGQMTPKNIKVEQ